MKNIYLIGQTCSGKSTSAKKLSKKLGYDCIDQDDYVFSIYNKDGGDLNDIYANSIDFFNTLSKTVVVLGGRFGTRPNLKNCFENIIFLDASNDLVTERVLEERNHRDKPENKRRNIVMNSDNTQDIIDLCEERRPLYTSNSHLLFSYNSNEEQETIISEIYNSYSNKKQSSSKKLKKTSIKN